MPRRRRIMPWGKYKGVYMVHLPDDYVSWLATLKLDPKWQWLRDMIAKELRRRGLRDEFPDNEQPPAAVPRARKIRLQ